MPGEVLVTRGQLLFGFLYASDDAVDRTDFNTLRGVIMADTFGTFVGVDLINGLALRDGFVGAFGFAHITIDAFVGNHE